MGKIRVKMSDEVIRKFKEQAILKFGSKRGAYKKAAEEAIQAWILEKKQNSKLRVSEPNKF